MKNKDLKKAKESTIGKIIYGFLLFMPLIAIGSTILYTTFNKNAYQSFTNEDNTKTYVDNYTNGNTYYFNENGGENFNTNKIPVEMLDLSTNKTELQSYYDNNENNIKAFKLERYGTSFAIYFYDLADTQMNYSILQQTNNLYLKFITKDTGQFGLNDTFYQLNDNNLLSNSFYYAVDKVEQSPLFNWAENSLIYTGINNTCEQLSITTTFIPLLLAYWLIISMIYILYDIVLMILIILHNKIHQLQDSI